jgi:cytoskeleton protein RodZ
MMAVSEHSFGGQLKSARERSGLSLEAVADTLRLDPKCVAALEQEDLRSLPAPIYVRGYIRAYAQLVRCEADVLVAQYNAQAVPEPELTPVVSLFQQEGGQERNVRLKWVTAAGAAMLLMLIAGIWLIEPGTSDETVDVAATETLLSQNTITEESAFETPAEAADMLPAFTDLQSAESAEQTADATAAPSGVQPLAPTAAAPVAPAPSSSVVFEEQKVVQPKVIQPPAGLQKDEAIVLSSPTGQDRLRLVFLGESWAEVFDANGYRLIFGLFNEEMQPVLVQGQAPFQLTLGDARRVSISINGQIFNVDSYIQQNNMARFMVEPPR